MATQIFKMVKVGYMFQSQTNQQRNGALILKAPTIADATKAARDQLAKEYDWFKITKAVVLEGDEPQKSL